MGCTISDTRGGICLNSDGRKFTRELNKEKKMLTQRFEDHQSHQLESMPKIVRQDLSMEET